MNCFARHNITPDNFTLNTLLSCCEPANSSPVDKEGTKSPTATLDFTALFERVESPDHITYLAMVRYLRYDWKKALTYHSESAISLSDLLLEHIEVCECFCEFRNRTGCNDCSDDLTNKS